MKCYVLVYRRGTKSTVRGVPCEFKRVDISEVEKLKHEGWVSSVYGLLEKKESKKDLASVFLSNPKELTKKELKEYAASIDLKLSMKMLEDNMIEAIQKKLDEA